MTTDLSANARDLKATAETILIPARGICLFAFPDSSAYLFKAVPCPNCTCGDCRAYEAKELMGKEADDEQDDR